MKHSAKSLIFILLLCISRVFGQAPEIEWQNTIGSNGDDILCTIKSTEDGGYIIGGYSGGGIYGDKTVGNNGFTDFWILKLNSVGDIIWQKGIGGNSTDILTTLENTNDGGIILGGYSHSGISGDKTEANITGSFDYWIVKLDVFGNIEWQNTIGGAGNDELYALKPTSDGGYILGGRSNSPATADKSEASDEYYDFWVVKVDSLGIIEWENTVGGAEYDYLYSIIATPDNNYLVAGWSNSPVSGDKTDGGYLTGGTGDYWFLKLDFLGNIIWQNAIGGDQSDWLYDIIPGSNNGYVLSGYSNSSISGDKTAERCDNDPVIFNDYWIVKTDDLGIVEWQNAIGGLAEDRPLGIHGADSGYVVGGYSYSGISCDKTDPNIGFMDYWVMKLDTVGDIEWQKNIGGWTDDVLIAVDTIADGGYIIGGYSDSPATGDKTEDNIGGIDFWIIKLAGNCTPILYYADEDGDGYGNSFSGISSCVSLAGYVLDSTDCDDENSLINPGLSEICNEIDDNCNFEIDEDLITTTYYFDSDSDGYGNALIYIIACFGTPPLGYTLDNTDCDDANLLIHEPILFYFDFDEDLYGDSLNSAFFCSMFAPVGYVTNNLDCNDSNNFINPLSNEICNNADDNCNTEIDEGLPTQTLFIDADNDNFGNYLIDTITCFFEIAGYVSDNTDCDDSNPFVYPDAPEILDGLDNDCNQLIDEGVGINGLEGENAISIYPNPVNDKIILSINTQFNTNSSSYISICDLSGKNILQIEIKLSETEIDVSQFIAGIYFVKVMVDGNHFVQKLIIE